MSLLRHRLGFRYLWLDSKFVENFYLLVVIDKMTLFAKNQIF